MTIQETIALAFQKIGDAGMVFLDHDDELVSVDKEENRSLNRSGLGLCRQFQQGKLRDIRLYRFPPGLAERLIASEESRS